MSRIKHVCTIDSTSGRFIKRRERHCWNFEKYWGVDPPERTSNLDININFKILDDYKPMHQKYELIDITTPI